MSMIDRMYAALDCANKFNGRFRGQPMAFYLGAIEYSEFGRECRHMFFQDGKVEFCGTPVWQVNVKNHFRLAKDAAE